MNKRSFHVIIVLFLSILQVLSQNDPSLILPLKPGSNYRIYPGNLNQTEVFITKSPLDQKILFSSCNTLNFIPFFISEGIFVSDNGGSRWSGNDTCTGSPISFHGGDPGITIDKNGTFVLTRMGRAPFVGLYSHYSLDNGQTWSAQNAISTDDLERAALATDLNSGQAYYGRTYAVWVKFALPFPLMFSYTDDGAKNWSSPVPINNPVNRSAGGDVAIGPEGQVYACWAGVTDVSPFREIFVGFASSDNGGADWNVTENAFPVNGINGVLSNKANIRVNGLPGIAVDTNNNPRKGWIYIVSAQKDLAPAGSDPDIILHRSTDGGLTWEPGIRVNQDPLNNGKTQYFPSVHVDKFGGLNILFYDDAGTTDDSTGVALARSMDGGDTWMEFMISDHNFKPKPIGGLGQGYQGDNIDLTSTDSLLIPVWMDNSTGMYQIWSVPVAFSEVSDIGEKNQQGLPGLQQNYPNPFIFNTTIGFNIKTAGHVSLTVLDILGNEITSLVNEYKSPGYYEARFILPEVLKSSSVKEGILIVKLLQKERIDTKKMLFINPSLSQ